MSLESRAKRTRAWRFGVFEVDDVGVKLLRGGIQVRIQEQPFRILVFLLEHAGELVTREELCRMLWSADTFVDFDHSLNTAVMKLREALGDSAERPLYIETIPKRGYRFVCAVLQTMDAENGQENNGASPASSPITLTNGIASSAPLTIEHGSDVRSKYWKRRALYATALLGVIIAIAGGVVFWKIDRPPREPRVVRFTRLTDDGQAKVGPLTIDGSRIYFTEILPDAHKLIAQVSASGGETTTIPTQLRQPGILDLSDDGTEFLLSSNDETNKLSFWLQPVAGGSPRRVGTLLGTGAAFSADGSGVVYGDDHGIYSADRDGVVSRRLFPLEHSAFDFRFSPDAKAIRFSQVDRSNDTTFITEVSVDGTHARKVADGCCGEWIHDRHFFIYQRRVDNRLNFWALPEWGARYSERRSIKATQLTAGPMDFTYPLPSKDGKRIYAIASTRQAEIIRYISRNDTFAPYLSGISADGLAFSPDGLWVAYTSYPDATLWRSRVDGSERLQLTFSHMRAAFPRWSPDGKQIAFSGNLPDEPWNIYLISSAGGTAEHLLPSRESQMDVNWSPKGDSLLYCACGEVHPSLSILNLRSRNVSTVPHSLGLYSPHWSPDGRYISGTATGTRKLMLYDLVTREWKLAYDGGISFPNWSHDGKYLYFQFFPSVNLESGAIGRLRLSDRRVEHVAGLSSIGRLTTGTIGRWFGLAPDNSLLFARDISLQEIYALDTEWE